MRTTFVFQTWQSVFSLSLSLSAVAWASSPARQRPVVSTRRSTWRQGIRISEGTERKYTKTRMPQSCASKPQGCQSFAPAKLSSTAAAEQSLRSLQRNQSSLTTPLTTPVPTVTNTVTRCYYPVTRCYLEGCLLHGGGYVPVGHRHKLPRPNPATHLCASGKGSARPSSVASYARHGCQGRSATAVHSEHDYSKH